MVIDTISNVVEELNRYLNDSDDGANVDGGIRERIISFRDDAEQIRFMFNAESGTARFVTVPSMSNEDFAKLLCDQELHENEDGSFSGNYHGYFPCRYMVERVLSGPAEHIAYSKGRYYFTDVYRNRSTGEYYEAYWAQGCGEPHHRAVTDLPSLLSDINNDQLAYVEFSDTNLVAFNLPKDVWERIKARAGAAGLSYTEWVRRELEASLLTEKASLPTEVE